MAPIFSSCRFLNSEVIDGGARRKRHYHHGGIGVAAACDERGAAVFPSIGGDDPVSSAEAAVGVMLGCLLSWPFFGLCNALGCIIDNQQGQR